jgi:hypothetical protein
MAQRIRRVQVRRAVRARRSRMEILLQMFVQFFAAHFAIAKDFRK